MTDKTIRIVSQDKCTGCGACYNKCPNDAIEMREDREGFLFPSVLDNCSSCGTCQNACPVLKPVKVNGTPQCYAVWADQKTRLVSSSGGMFTVLARKILAEGGVVFGAVCRGAVGCARSQAPDRSGGMGADFHRRHHAGPRPAGALEKGGGSAGYRL